MGEIFAAVHVETHRRVAIKLLRSPHSRDQVSRERFRREAQATSRLVHEHIVEILDFGVDPEGTCYLVMELLYGEDLERTLRREGRLPLARAAKIVLQICSALDEAHRHGIVHRDLKPANCFRIGFKGVEDFIKLVDFGIAKQIGSDEPEDNGPLTQAGAIIGTIYYMPPEQATGGHIDHRADVYAAGVLLYQMCTGRLPFKGERPEDTYRLLLTVEAPPVAVAAPDAGLPPSLDPLFRRALAKNPDERIPTAAALAEAIRAAIPRQPDGHSGTTMVALRPPVEPQQQRWWVPFLVLLIAAAATALALTLR